jgi:hypothetical protein
MARAACVLGLLSLPVPALAQVPAPAIFGAPQTTTGALPRGVDVADLDGDGLMDVIVAMEQDDYLDVRLGDGSGRFPFRRAQPSVANGPRALAIADFNRDGLLDVAVGHCGAASVWVLPGDGTGLFSRDPDRAASAGDCVQAIVAVDVNGDGVPDVIVASASGVRVLLSDGSGGFLSEPVQVLTDARFGLASGDLDGDGDLDVVASGLSDVRVLRNTGAGLAPAGAVVTGTGVGVALGDVDGDGRLDLATSEIGNAVTIARGDGAGGFERPETFSLGARGVRVEIADLDGDGRGEVVVLAQPAESSPGRLAIIRLERPGDRFVITTQEVGRTPLGLRVARIDRDYAPDVVMTSGLSCVRTTCSGAGEITVLLNRGLNGLGAYRLSPLETPDPRAMAAGDLTGNGVLDLVVAHGNENVVRVLINDGLGNFRSTVLHDLRPEVPTAVAVGDVDGDGDLDIVVGDVWRILLLRNRGDGTFDAPETVTTTLRVQQLALADMDADGNLDIVLLSSRELAVLTNGGGGTFPFDFEGVRPREGAEVFAVGDVNGDGTPEVIVSARGSFLGEDVEWGLDVYGFSGGELRRGSGIPTGRQPRALAVGDLDGDGRDEIVVATDGVTVRSQATAGFSRTSLVGASLTTTSLILADVDLDGHLDIIASEGRHSEAPSEGITIWRGDGIGGFTPGDAYLAGSDSLAVAVGPMSLREGRPGLAVLDAARHNVWTLLQGFGTLIDTDFDLLPDLLESILGLDPLDMDSDNDGLMDGIDPDALRAAAATIPPTAWRRPGLQQAFDAVLRSLDPLIRLRQAQPVQQTLAFQFSRFDGCLSSQQPDPSDWVVNCQAQELLQTVTTTISWNLELYFSQPHPELLRVVNPRSSRGGAPPEWLLPGRGRAPGSVRDRDREPLPPLPSCGPASEILTMLPTSLVDLAAIVPMGFTSPPAYTLPIPRIYPVSRIDTSKGAPEWLPLFVVSPANARVVAIVRTTDAQTGWVDYAVYLRPCLEVRLDIQHLQALASVLDDAIADIDATGTALGEGVLVKTVDIALGAGEVIGISQPGGYGIGLVDERAADLPFANPDRYRLPDAVLASMSPEEREAYLSVAIQPLKQFCPTDSFAEPARSSLEALFGSADGQMRRLVPPVCGEHEQDEPGTARGNWFVPNTNALVGQPSSALALVGDAVQPDQPLFSVSTVFGVDAATNVPVWPADEYLFAQTAASGTRVNERFENVRAGAVYCYDGLQRRTGAPLDGIVLVEVFAGQGGEPADRLRIERQQNAQSCAGTQAWTFTGNARVFER